MAISNISSEATGPVVTIFYVEPSGYESQNEKMFKMVQVT